MHLNIVEETEWDAAGELGYVIQAAQNMRIHYFNAIVLGVHRSDIQDGYRFITAIFCRHRGIGLTRRSKFDIMHG